MPFTVEFRDDGTPVRWAVETVAEATDELPGATATADPEYRPAVYVAARDDRTRYLDWLADALGPDPKVDGIERVERRRDLRAEDPSPMLRVALERTGEIRQLAREIRVREHNTHAPGTLSLYDVDLDPGFRYCLDTGRDPRPVVDSDTSRSLRRLSLSLPDPALASDDLTALTVDGDPAGDTERQVRRTVERILAETDPDVLVLSSGEIVPLLADAGVDLGRDAPAVAGQPDYRKLAGASTYESYGQVGHSPARYDVPGRVLVDRSNSFLLGHSGMAGLSYFVERAGKPLQELARDSIGGVLTAIEIREARQRGVPAPWQKRQTEGWKSVDTLHAADRGGFTFQPDPGVYEDVHELDFASLYPNVIREYGVSPDTVDCDCHDTADVPELGYSLCDRDAFLGAVLGPLLNDRAEWKRRLDTGNLDPETRRRLDAKADAVKWVLVSSFGYQGYRHAKFGRIEVHEAINACARDLMLRAKDAFERAGWRVVHGIVDSLWVRADPDRDSASGPDRRPVRDVAREVSDEVGIRLEHEGKFDWVAFCPRKRASGAALMRYFGRWSDGSVAGRAEEDPEEDGGRYKFRGIETRQRSTCPFVADAQRDLVATFDRERDPEAVCERLRAHRRRLRRGAVPAADLAICQRVSKQASEYTQATRSKAALERATALGLERHPGQSVEYVVVDDDLSGPERVRLAFEEGRAYDTAFYADRLVRACESVVAPLGWDQRRIRGYLREDRDATLASFVRSQGEDRP